MKLKQVLQSLVNPEINVDNEGAVTLESPAGPIVIAKAIGELHDSDGNVISQGEEGPFYSKKYCFFKKGNHVTRIFEISGIATGNPTYREVELASIGMSEQDLIYSVPYRASDHAPIPFTTSSAARSQSVLLKGSNGQRIIEVQCIALEHNVNQLSIVVDNERKFTPNEDFIIAFNHLRPVVGTELSYRALDVPPDTYVYYKESLSRTVVIKDAQGNIKRVINSAKAWWQSESEGPVSNAILYAQSYVDGSYEIISYDQDSHVMYTYNG